jgi:hypothetical protein
MGQQTHCCLVGLQSLQDNKALAAGRKRKVGLTRKKKGEVVVERERERKKRGEKDERRTTRDNFQRPLSITNGHVTTLMRLASRLIFIM